MRLLVIGDSHTASVKYAWEDIAPACPDIELDFFALPVERIRHLRRDGNRLVLSPKASPGNQAMFTASFPEGYIEPSQYDATLLVGLMEQMHSLVLSHRTTTLPETSPAPRRGFWRGLAAKTPAMPMATRPTFEAAWDDIFAASKAAVLTRRIAKLNLPSVFLSINPLVSSTVLTGEKLNKAAYRAAIDHGAVEIFSDIVAQGLRRNLPANIKLIAQPPDTIVSGCMTDKAFMTGAEKYYGEGEGFAKGDILHANRQFGRRVLEQVFAQLTQ